MTPVPAGSVVDEGPLPTNDGPPNDGARERSAGGFPVTPAVPLESASASRSNACANACGPDMGRTTMLRA